MSDIKLALNKTELRDIIRSFKAMDDEAADEAKKMGYEIAKYAADEIKSAARTRTVNPEAVRRIADGVRVSKTSKVAEFSYGFASQRFSGGGTTQKLWAGFEFGSNRYKQFPKRTPRSSGRGNLGYFIYPTLRRIQPELVKQWLESFDRILKKWN